jgi:hypothetical protein
VKFREYPASPEQQARHRGEGGLQLRVYAAQVHDGWIRVLRAIEPFSDDGVPRLHVSVSFSAHVTGNPSRKRPPTDAECHEVLEQLAPRLELVEQNHPGSLARHYWQTSGDKIIGQFGQGKTG